jgi:hypothetical protein
VAQIFEQRIDVERGQPGVSLFVGTLQPLKRFVGLSAIRINLKEVIEHYQRGDKVLLDFND